MPPRQTHDTIGTHHRQSPVASEISFRCKNKQCESGPLVHAASKIGFNRLCDHGNLKPDSKTTESETKLWNHVLPSVSVPTKISFAHRIKPHKFPSPTKIFWISPIGFHQTIETHQRLKLHIRPDYFLHWNFLLKIGMPQHPNLKSIIARISSTWISQNLTKHINLLAPTVGAILSLSWT